MKKKTFSYFYNSAFCIKSKVVNIIVSYERTQGDAASAGPGNSVNIGSRHTRHAPARATGAFWIRVQRCTRGISCACWNGIV